MRCQAVFKYKRSIIKEEKINYQLFFPQQKVAVVKQLAIWDVRLSDFATTLFDVSPFLFVIFQV